MTFTKTTQINLLEDSSELIGTTVSIYSTNTAVVYEQSAGEDVCDCLQCVFGVCECLHYILDVCIYLQMYANVFSEKVPRANKIQRSANEVQMKCRDD